ncbi:MAG: hypothetical protein ACXWU5_10990, partial [Rhodoplanes sp.]
MSISEQTPGATDFERWLPSVFAEMGAFTALVVLVDIEGTRVTPLCSTYFNVIGDKVVWDDIVLMFAGSGADWDGAAFFPATGVAGGPLDNPTARLRLRALEARLAEDRLVLNEGRFFDCRGRRLKIEEVT